MEVLSQDREAFSFIRAKLGKIGYEINNIKIYKLSMSFFLALDVSFINKHKEKIAELFYKAFQKFPNTSAFFVFGKKDEIKDIGKEITYDFLKEIDKMDKQTNIFYWEYNEMNNQGFENIIANLNSHIKKHIYRVRIPQKTYQIYHTYNNLYEFYISANTIYLEKV